MTFFDLEASLSLVVVIVVVTVADVVDDDPRNQHLKCGQNLVNNR